jgi:hypothetical protein
MFLTIRQFTARFTKWYTSCEIPPEIYSGMRSLLFPPDFLLSWLAKRAYPMYRLWNYWSDATKIAFSYQYQPTDSTPECFSADKSKVSRLQSDGVLKLPNAFPAAWIAEAREYVLERFESAATKVKTMSYDPKKTLSWIEDDGVFVECIQSQGRYRFQFPNSAVTESILPPFVSDFMRLPVVHGLVEAYFGMAVTSRRPYCMAEVVLSGGEEVEEWHLDCLRLGVKAMLYLNDVGNAQAPFRYLVGSHIPDAEMHHQLYRIARSGLDESRFDDQTNASYDERAEIFTGHANSLILFDNRGKHAGSLCTNGMRIALINGFRPATSLRINPRFFPNLPPDS